MFCASGVYEGEVISTHSSVGPTSIPECTLQAGKFFCFQAKVLVPCILWHLLFLNVSGPVCVCVCVCVRACARPRVCACVGGVECALERDRERGGEGGRERG